MCNVPTGDHDSVVTTGEKRYRVAPYMMEDA